MIYLQFCWRKIFLILLILNFTLKLMQVLNNIAKAKYITQYYSINMFYLIYSIKIFKKNVRISEIPLLRSLNFLFNQDLQRKKNKILYRKFKIFNLRKFKILS